MKQTFISLECSVDIKGVFKFPYLSSLTDTYRHDDKSRSSGCRTFMKGTVSRNMDGKFQLNRYLDIEPGLKLLVR
jgi:hypothetical protein